MLLFLSLFSYVYDHVLKHRPILSLPCGSGLALYIMSISLHGQKKKRGGGVSVIRFVSTISPLPQLSRLLIFSLRLDTKHKHRFSDTSWSLKKDILKNNRLGIVTRMLPAEPNGVNLLVMSGKCGFVYVVWGVDI